MVNADRPASLTSRTVRGAGWIVSWRVVTRILGTVSTLFLVRLLAPGDFGLVALGTTFANALDGLSEIGVGNALVREHSLDRAMYDTGFTLNAIRGSTSALLIICSAWPVAGFFGEPRLATILLALSAAMFISSLENIGIVDFQRSLAFEKEFSLLLAPRILGIVACVTTAYVWRSYWALVVGILTTRGTRMLCTYVIHSYRPRLSLRAWRQIVGFSFWSWMLAWVSLIRDRIDNFVIGRMLGATQVGLYSIAWDIGFLTSTELVAPICRALFPGLVQVRSRGNDVADAYFRAISATLVVILPAGIGIALVADPLMRLVVGPRWLAAIPLVQIFAVVGIFRVVTFISTTLLTVFGMLKVQFASTLSILLVRFTLLIIMIDHFGLVGSGFAVATVALLEEGFYLILTFRRFNLRPAKLLASNWRSVIATATMAGAVILMRNALSWGTNPTFGDFFAQVFGGALTYVIVLLGAWLAAGRPLGAEAQVISVAREVARLLRRRWLPAR
ncbi:MAG TPA: lipopolysaccharide biosynthesis protein [Acetobacteraceae bacterium]|nr:lipopolysaccharide biosynthesis protein [Acetobacteraceae bacterium]